MRLTYDKSSDAAYIYLTEEKKEIEDTRGDRPIHVDLTAEGEVVGIEIMDASKVLAPDYLAQAK